MEVLYAAGCSFTYGDGLKDCWDETLQQGIPDKPSQFAWPSIAAKKLNAKCINLALPGGSNLAVTSQLLGQDLYPRDIVVVMWTFLTRTAFYNELHLNHGGEWWPEYLECLETNSSNSDVIMKNLINIYTTTVYLESKGVRIYYMFVDKLLRQEVGQVHLKLYDKLIGKIKKYDITEEVYEPIQSMFSRGQLKPGLDGQHPGEDYHKKLGTKLVEMYLNPIERNFTLI